jgi:hypothetical protein
VGKRLPHEASMLETPDEHTHRPYPRSDGADQLADDVSRLTRRRTQPSTRSAPARGQNDVEARKAPGVGSAGPETWSASCAAGLILALNSCTMSLCADG